MSHAIKDGRPICLEPETAMCRAQWNYQDCGCEFYGETWQNEDGTWTHLAYDVETDDDVEHTSVGNYSARNCNLCNWLDDDLRGTANEESVQLAWMVDVEIPDGLIVCEWEGDYYTWRYSEATPALGRFIAQVAVGRWAEDKGLAA